MQIPSLQLLRTLVDHLQQNNEEEINNWWDGLFTEIINVIKNNDKKAAEMLQNTLMLYYNIVMSVYDEKVLFNYSPDKETKKLITDLAKLPPLMLISVIGMIHASSRLLYKGLGAKSSIFKEEEK